MELIWEGKEELLACNQAGDAVRSGVCLELQELHGDCSSVTSELGQANCLIKGDSKVALQALLGNYRESVDVIYIDPPFDIGGELKQDFKLNAKNSSAASISIPAYRDSWGSGQFSYVHVMYERLRLCEQLLRKGGAIFVHCDYRTTAIFRLLLDEIFGADQHVNELIWFYKTGGVPEKLGFGKKHDTIHYYVKTRDGVTWNSQKEKSYLQHRYGFSNIEIHHDQRGPYCMVNCRDVFDIPALRGNQPERVDYPTQKPEALLERLITATSNEGDLVLDCFCGSGTTAAVAQRLKRRWIAIDAGEIAIDCTKRRMLSLWSDLPKDVPQGSFEVRSVEKVQREYILAEMSRAGDSCYYFERVAKLYGIELFDEAGDEVARFGRYGDSIACICSPQGVVGAEVCCKCLELRPSNGDEEIVFFVWDSNSDLGSTLCAMGREYGGSMSAVRVDSNILNPAVGSMGVVTSLPALDAQVLVPGQGQFAIELSDYRIKLFAGLPAMRKVFEQTSSLALLSYWGISISAPEQSEFRPEWQSFRTRANPSVEIQSSVLKIPSDSQMRLRIVACDVFGNRTEQGIEILH